MRRQNAQRLRKRRFPLPEQLAAEKLPRLPGKCNRRQARILQQIHPILPEIPAVKHQKPLVFQQGEGGIGVIAAAVSGKESLPVRRDIHTELPDPAGAGRNRRPALKLPFRPEPEPGVKVQHAVVGKEIHAVGVRGIRQRPLHEKAGKAPSAPFRMGHHRSQLDKAFLRAVQAGADVVDGHAGNNPLPAAQNIGPVFLPPIAAPVPGRKIQRKNLPGQLEKALPQGGDVPHLPAAGKPQPLYLCFHSPFLRPFLHPV